MSRTQSFHERPSASIPDGQPMPDHRPETEREKQARETERREGLAPPKPASKPGSA